MDKAGSLKMSSKEQHIKSEMTSNNSSLKSNRPPRPLSKEDDSSNKLKTPRKSVEISQYSIESITVQPLVVPEGI